MSRLPEPAEPAARISAPRLETDRWLGRWLDGKFLLEARLAIGGFGAVYRARNAAGLPVALKILHPWLTDDATMVARFGREGATLIQLHSANTVRTHAVGETGDGVRYIAMELLTGESLHDRLRRTGALAWQSAVAIARAVCDSLAEAHALGVIHRDLKPSNIHLEPGDHVKVIDFGIAKLAPGGALSEVLDDGRELTAVGHMIGTYEYMAPEQLAGEPCDARADLYALGLVLYEMLTGRRPFAAGSNPASMMAALLTQSPAPPSIYAAIPPGIDRIVMRCLSREPRDRYADVGQLVDAIDAVVAACSSRDDVTVEQPTLFDSVVTWSDDDAPAAAEAAPAPAPIVLRRFPTLPGIGAIEPPRRAAHGTPIPALRRPRPHTHPQPPSRPVLTRAPRTAPPAPAARAASLAWIALVVAGLAFTALVAAIVTAALL
ncbi:MAG TPA: serine/threonine-protein kinase [Kofleriaceae bacterium]|nr:serine/threonine-protein kinase [Kofleriaceae bacterium]